MPTRATFVDGRFFPFLPGVLTDYAAMVEVRPGWRELLERHAIREVPLRPGTPLAGALLDSGWFVRARGNNFVYLAQP